MTPESPLQQCKRHLENFQAQTPKTVKADEVQVNQEVSFKVNCREEALETLTIHNIVQDFKDGDTEYLMLQETVDGPVTDMWCMFNGCHSFNQDLSAWDVSQVINVSFMFDDCTSFNQDLSAWDVSQEEIS